MTIRRKKPAPPKKAAAKKREATKAKPMAAQRASPTVQKARAVVKRVDRANANAGGGVAQPSANSSGVLDKALSDLNKATADRNAAHVDRPTLPADALVIMRVSGGFSFSSREVVVFADGRSSSRHSEHGRGELPAIQTKLDARALDAIRSQLTAANFSVQRDVTLTQRPDSYTCELVARVGDDSKFIDVFDGAIPQQLVLLVSHLKALLVS